RLEHAGRTAMLPSNAQVVRVELAQLAAGVSHDEPRATVSAPNGALEIVVVLALLQTLALGREDVLHPLPRLGINQRRVLALILDAVIRDDALVVRAAQDAAEVPDGDGLARRCRPAS